MWFPAGQSTDLGWLEPPFTLLGKDILKESDAFTAVNNVGVLHA